MKPGLDTLPTEVLDAICQPLVSAPKSLAALSLACRVTNAAASRQLRALRSKWTQWLCRAPAPRIASKQEADKMDQPLLAFILDEATRQKTLRDLDGKSRKWVHCRAEQLGLTTQTTRRRTIKKLGMYGDVVVRKSPGWQMAWDAPPAIAPRYPQPRPHGRVTRETWSSSCERCDRTLDAWEALYSLSSKEGPLCDECVYNGDDDLGSYKWEAKADFWQR
ncbi:hypothetical protein V8C86DRAFT_2581671 [Haematococcus lacustris]